MENSESVCMAGEIFPREENRILGPITATKIDEQKQFWVRRVQNRCPERVEEDRLSLNLQQKKIGVPECRVRVQGQSATYIPDTSGCLEKRVEQAHERTLHGSGSYHDKDKRTVSYPWFERTRQTFDQPLRRMETISGSSRSMFAARTVTKEPNRRNNGI